MEQLDVITTEMLIKGREALISFHASNNDWKRVLQDKWVLTTLAQK